MSPAEVRCVRMMSSLREKDGNGRLDLVWLSAGLQNVGSSMRGQPQGESIPSSSLNSDL
jgi:hypothetical protein